MESDEYDYEHPPVHSPGVQLYSCPRCGDEVPVLHGENAVCGNCYFTPVDEQ